MKHNLKMRIPLLLLIFVSSSLVKTLAQDYFIGGMLGYSIPTNIGNSEEYGFKDYADKGWEVAAVGKWFYQQNLSLGYHIGYQFQAEGEIWDVDRYGDVSASYQTFRLLLNGAYYFSQDEIRPYLGLSFGAYYMINTMDFDASSATNKSVAYTAKEWKPGIAPQVGVLLELSKKTMLDCKLQMDLVAHMEPTVVIDPDYGAVTQNPHGNQNQFSFSVALIFGL